MLFTCKGVDPSTRTILEGGSSWNHIFSLSGLHAKGFTCPSVRIFQAERNKDPSTNETAFARKRIVLGTNQIAKMAAGRSFVQHGNQGGTFRLVVVTPSL